MATDLKTEKIVLNIAEEVKSLPARELKEVLDFVFFIKMKSNFSPSQSYFWTKMWQKMENEVDDDKKSGNILGDGRVKNLLKELKKRED